MDLCKRFAARRVGHRHSPRGAREKLNGVSSKNQQFVLFCRDTSNRQRETRNHHTISLRYNDPLFVSVPPLKHRKDKIAAAGTCRLIAIFHLASGFEVSFGFEERTLDVLQISWVLPTAKEHLIDKEPLCGRHRMVEGSTSRTGCQALTL